MSRRHSAERREILPDPKFGNVVVSKFMNSIMYQGKKSVAENIVYGAFDLISEKQKDKSPLEVLQTAMENVKPRLEVLKTTEPAGRKAGVKVKSVGELVDKLKNEVGLI